MALHHDETGDPEICVTRVAQYEARLPHAVLVGSREALTDLSDEPQSILLDLYGPDVQKPGSYASNCLLAPPARRATGTCGFIQLYHMGWDQHGDLPSQIKSQCNDTDLARRP